MTIPEQAVEAAAREIAEMVRDCANTFFPKQVATTFQTDTLTLGFANLIRKHLTAAQPLMGVERTDVQWIVNQSEECPVDTELTVQVIWALPDHLGAVTTTRAGGLNWSAVAAYRLAPVIAEEQTGAG